MTSLEQPGYNQSTFNIRATLWEGALKSYGHSKGDVNIPFEVWFPDSPFVDMIWHGHAEQDSVPQCPSDVLWYIRFLRQNGKLSVTVHGPTTRATPVPYLKGDEFLGIRFRPGVFMPQLPPSFFVNGTTRLAAISSSAFWFDNSKWEIPTYANADAFINRLVRENVLVHDPVVRAALQGQRHELSLRSVQLRFLRATGLTHKVISQIERARYAAALLKQGVPGMDVASEIGYFDQSHFTRSLKRFLGQTPTQIALLELSK